MRTDRDPCDWCGYYHRFGTTDPEHEHSWVACINTLTGEIEQLRRLLFAQSVRDTVDRYWRVLNRIEPELPCSRCRGPLSDGECSACEADK